MIILKRLGGQDVAVNPDLIERAEATPDTVLTMIDGHKMVVAESIPEVIERVRLWRAQVVAEAFHLGRDPDEWQTSTTTLDDAPNDDRARLTELSDQATLDRQMAQVLRLPQRGE